MTLHVHKKLTDSLNLMPEFLSGKQSCHSENMVHIDPEVVVRQGCVSE